MLRIGELEDESEFPTPTGLLLGAVAGWSLAYVLVKILTGVFDPPPEHLQIPWRYLAAFIAATGLAVLVAVTGMIRATRKPALEIVRDL